MFLKITHSTKYLVLVFVFNQSKSVKSPQKKKNRYNYEFSTGQWTNNFHTFSCWQKAGLPTCTCTSCFNNYSAILYRKHVFQIWIMECDWVNSYLYIYMYMNQPFCIGNQRNSKQWNRIQEGQLLFSFDMNFVVFL